MCIVYAIEAQGGARGSLVDAFGVYSDPVVSAFLEKVPIRGARRFGGGLDERPWAFGPPGEIRERKRIPEPARFGAYRHGVPLPVPSDPWRDEGGERRPAPSSAARPPGGPGRIPGPGVGGGAAAA